MVLTKLANRHDAEVDTGPNITLNRPRADSGACRLGWRWADGGILHGRTDDDQTCLS